MNYHVGVRNLLNLGPLQAQQVQNYDGQYRSVRPLEDAQGANLWREPEVQALGFSGSALNSNLLNSCVPRSPQPLDQQDGTSQFSPLPQL